VKRRSPDSKPAPPIALWQPLLAAAVAAVVVVGLIALTVRLHPSPDGSWSDSIRSVGFAAAAIVAVPVGYIAYRRQRVLDQQHQLADTKDYRDRFVTATAQIGGDSIMARLAGVYALANLADEWGEHTPSQRQVCIDVLCAYLRTAYDPTTDNLTTTTQTERTTTDGHGGGTKDVTTRTALRDDRDVRLTIIRIIRDHLRPTDTKSPSPTWQGHDFDFTGAVIPAGSDFTKAVFSGGRVSFTRAVFSGGRVSFTRAVFSGGQVLFDEAVFSGSEVRFHLAVFSDGHVSFERAVFSGGQVSVIDATFSGGQVSFEKAVFSGGQVWFFAATFSGSQVVFDGAEFSGAWVSFDSANFSGGQVSFDWAKFFGGRVSFDNNAVFSGGAVTRDGELFRGWSESQ